MYQAACAAMCYDAGRLVAVRYGVIEFDDGSDGLHVAVIMDFEVGSWVISVNADDDTIHVANAAEAFPLDGLTIRDAPADSPWTRALGSSPQWIWTLENQQGFEDGIQFAFARDGRAGCQIQLIAMASGWQLAELVQLPAVRSIM